MTSRGFLVALSLVAVAATACEPADRTPSTLATALPAARETEPAPSSATPTATRAPATRAPATPTKAAVVAPPRKPAPTKPPAVKPKPVAPVVDTCGAAKNPWGFNHCGRGSTISNPPAAFCTYFDCIDSFWENTKGYVMRCDDGMYSHSGGRSGSCSKHDGNDTPLYG